MAKISIITYGKDISPVTRSKDDTLLGPMKSIASSIQTISSETLEENFNTLLNALEKALTIPDKIGSFKVDALDIQLELTAEGQLGLLGNGGKVGGKGSLTLRLKR